MNGTAIRQIADCKQIADEAESLALLLATAQMAATEIKAAIAETRQQNPNIDQITGMSDLEWAISLLDHHHGTCVALLKRGGETLLGLGQSKPEGAAA